MLGIVLLIVELLLLRNLNLNIIDPAFELRRANAGKCRQCIKNEFRLYKLAILIVLKDLLLDLGLGLAQGKRLDAAIGSGQIPRLINRHCIAVAVINRIGIGKRVAEAIPRRIGMALDDGNASSHGRCPR